MRTPHFDPADLDANVPICTDLNAHVNGKWLAANPIPADKTSWGNFNMLGERSLDAQKQIVEAAGKGGFPAGSNEQKLGDFYRLGMDEAKVNADGIAPVKPTLDKVNAITDSAGIANFLYDSFAHGDAQLFTFDAAEEAAEADPDGDNARAAAYATAIAFARRRRFGPFARDHGDGAADPARQRRELAAMARAGHDFDVARHVLDAHSEAEALALSGE